MRSKAPSRHPKKILYINPTADLYGASQVLLKILDYLPRNQFVPVVVLPNKGILEQHLARMQVASHVLPVSVIRRGVLRGINLLKFMLSFWPNVIRLALFIRKNEIDLVHTCATVTLTGAFAAKLTGVPHIWHIHEIVSDEFPSLWGLYCKLVTLLSTRIVCVSKVTARQFPDEGKVRIIPNGIDLNVFKVAAHHGEKTSFWDQGKKGGVDIGMIGRLSPRKGQSYLLDAYVNLLNHRKNDTSRLIIVGDIFPGYEHYLHELKSKVQDLGLEEKVIFTGFLEDPASIYPFLDMVIVPSLLPEGFGLVILEAMAFCLPVIATAHGGAMEVIEDGVSGLLVPYDDVNKLSKAMEYLIAHPEKGRQIGEAGYERVKQIFRIEKTNELIFQTYNEILSV